MDSIDLQLTSDHKQCIISLINKIVSKSPHLSDLKSDSILFLRLVSVISLIESTLCSKYQIVLKRNSSVYQSIDLIKSWLKQYYNQEFITSLCQNSCQTSEEVVTEEVIKSGQSVTENGSQMKDKAIDDNNDNNNNGVNEAIDRDIGLISLLILFIAHKLRQSLPRINAYFSPEWQSLSQFDSTLNRILNFDKLLDLVQNELCLKRNELEITKSKVLSLKSTIDSKAFHQNRQKKTKLDFRSNLFSELEDNETDEMVETIASDYNEEQLAEDSDGSPVFIDNSSDDDYKPINKSQKLSQKIVKKSTKSRRFVKKSGRGRGRPSKLSVSSIDITPKTVPKSRGPTKSAFKTISIEEKTDEEIGCDLPFECESCGKRFAKEYRLVRHSFTHLGHKQFVCDFPNCNESFDLKWKLSDHKSEHTGAVDDESLNTSNNTSFRCEWADCGLELGSKRELTQHEHQMHANRSQSKYSCDWPQCREIFENKIEWRKHVKTHGKIVPTECGFPGCPKSFYKLDSLENHRKVHEMFTLEELS